MPRTRRQRRRNILGGTGGVFPTDSNQSAEDRVKFFLENATIHVLSNGSFGITFIAELKPGVQSPFKNMVASHFGEPVEALVLKFCLISESYDPVTIELGNKTKLASVSPISFQEEINAQADVYACSVDRLYPLCPAIVYADIASKDNMDLLDIVIQQAPELAKLGAIVRSTTTRKLQYGVIVMELANHYETLWDFEHDNPQSGKENSFLMLAMLLRLARECGYTHGDFHQGNFMVKPQVLTNGDLVHVGQIIDFGFARKLSPREQQKFNALFDSRQYAAAIAFFCEMTRKDDYVLSDSSTYDVVCKATQLPGFSNDAIQQQLDLMERMQNVQFPTNLSNRRAVDPAVPTLPLPAEFRNQLFRGLNKIDRPELAPPQITLTPDELAAFQSAVKDALGLAGRNQKAAVVMAALRLLRYLTIDLLDVPTDIGPAMEAFLVCEEVLSAATHPVAKQMLADEKLCGQQEPRSFLQFLNDEGRAALNNLPAPQVLQLLLAESTYADPEQTAAQLNNVSRKRGRETKPLSSELEEPRRRVRRGGAATKTRRRRRTRRHHHYHH